MNRRHFLNIGLNSLGLSMFALVACRREAWSQVSPAPLSIIDDLQTQADANGLRLPEGFRSRIVAKSGQRVLPASDYVWHAAPDGGATFARPNGGWVYVSNCEVKNGAGGVGAIAFDAKGGVESAYAILSGSNFNCSGGATPWATWLSCEEANRGLVWECDPFGREVAVALPALGRFKHEAVAVDTVNRMIYMTEDQPDGRLYRFIPSVQVEQGRYDLRQGRLEVCQVMGEGAGGVAWLPIPDPAATAKDTRYQQAKSTVFAGAEGAYFQQGSVFFSSKYANRIWQYQTSNHALSVVYDAASYAKPRYSKPLLQGVDGVVVTGDGRIWVTEDADDMQVVVISPGKKLQPFLQLLGHASSEITGLAFDPAMQRLYFSSQRGSGGSDTDGVTYEVSGPFSSWGL